MIKSLHLLEAQALETSLSKSNDRKLVELG